MPTVAIGERISIRTGHLLVRVLEGRSVHVPIMLGEALFEAGFVADAAGAAAEGYMVIPLDKASFHAIAVLEGLVYVAAVHMHNVGVVTEVVATPLAARKADAAVTETVVDAAVIADVRSPIAFMEEKASAFPSPVAGSPEQAGSGSGHPSAGNPIVAGLI
jgi:hypothetical protein